MPPTSERVVVVAKGGPSPETGVLGNSKAVRSHISEDIYAMNSLRYCNLLSFSECRQPRPPSAAFSVTPVALCVCVLLQLLLAPLRGGRLESASCGCQQAILIIFSLSPCEEPPLPRACFFAARFRYRVKARRAAYCWQPKRAIICVKNRRRRRQLTTGNPPTPRTPLALVRSLVSARHLSPTLFLIAAAVALQVPRLLIGSE
jgi:hypothetical protein